jgi:hypothetical protein
MSKLASVTDMQPILLSCTSNAPMDAARGIFFGPSWYSSLHPSAYQLQEKQHVAVAALVSPVSRRRHF